MFLIYLFILYNNFKRPFYFEPENHLEGNEITIELSEEVTFLNKAAILNTLKELPEDAKVIIDATRTQTIDYDVIEIFEDFKENAKFKNIELTFKNFDVRKYENPGIVLKNAVVEKM